MNAQHSFDQKLDLARMKYNNMNQMIGLEENFVLPSSKLFAGSSKLRECFLLGKGNNMNMNHEGTNEQNKIKDYWNYHVHPSSVLSSMFLGKQKLGTTFLKGREDDETIPRQSTFTICSKHPFKVKAKLNSKSFRFLPTRILLGLYDYRLKHLAMMEEEDHDVITTLQVDGLAQFFRTGELESRGG